MPSSRHRPKTALDASTEKAAPKRRSGTPLRLKASKHNLRLQELLANADEQIRQGQGNHLRHELFTVSRLNVPREALLPLCQIARRVNLPEVGLRLLNRLVRDPVRGGAEASDAETAEYAASLVRIGAYQEALDLLQRLDPRKNPEILLFQAFALVNQWEYAPTIPLLKQYVAFPIADYQLLLGQINLAAAYVYEGQAEDASPLLRQILVTAHRDGLWRLYGNALELSAQNALHQKDWSSAQDFLKQAESFLSKTGDIDHLMVRKFTAFAEVLRHGPSRGALQLLGAVRTEAWHLGHWETVRDCDRVEAETTRNVPLLTHVYFGTPFASFRRRILPLIPAPPGLPEQYRWRLTDAAAIESIDLLSGRTDRGASLKVGQALYRLLETLASDFYRPFRLLSLHGKLHPEDYYNPQSSPVRIHQLLRRLRIWMTDQQIPLVIHERDGQYSLAATKPCEMIVYLSRPQPSHYPQEIKRLRQAFPNREFSCEEASRVLQVSLRSALNVLADARSNGALSRRGMGRATRYRFSVNPSKL